VLNPKVLSPAAGLPPARRRLGDRWALHEACRFRFRWRASPPSSAWRRLRQPPCPSLRRFAPG